VKFTLKPYTTIIVEDQTMGWVRDQEVYTEHGVGELPGLRVETTHSMDAVFFNIHEKRIKPPILVMDENRKFVEKEQVEESNRKLMMPATVVTSVTDFDRFLSERQDSSHVYVYYEQNRGIGPIAHFTASTQNGELTSNKVSEYISEYITPITKDTVVYLVYNGDVGLRYRYMQISKATKPEHFAKNPIRYGEDGDYIFDKSQNVEPDLNQPIWPDIPKPPTQEPPRSDTNSKTDPPDKPNAPGMDSNQKTKGAEGRRNPLEDVYNANPDIRSQFPSFKEFEEYIKEGEQPPVFEDPTMDGPQSRDDILREHGVHSREEFEKWLETPPDD